MNLSLLQKSATWTHKQIAQNRVRKQRGFILLELAIAGLIALLFAIWGAGAWKRDMQQASVNAHHAWMDGVRVAAHRYLLRYGDQLASDLPVGGLKHEGYVDWRQPTIAEFKADGLLSPSYVDIGPMRTQAYVVVAARPGCTQPCAPQALVHSTLVRDKKGQQEKQQTQVSQWLLAAEGLGGQVSLASPQLVRGPSFSWNNPPRDEMPALPIGTVALVAVGLTDQEQYLRVRDTRNPDFQGEMAVQGNIASGGSLSAASYLSIGAQAVRGSVCASEGLIAQEDNAGLLFCRLGFWRSAPGAGGGFSTNSRYGCATPEGSSTANPVTKGCWCGTGSAALRISDSGSASEMQSSGRTIGYLCVN